MNADIPTDLLSALQGADLLETFLSLPPSHQREYTKWVAEAAKPETRQRRATQAVERLRQKSAG